MEVEPEVGSEVGLKSASETGALELDLETDADRWFVAACLLAGRARKPVALSAWRALEAAGLATPAALAGAGPEHIALVLDAADYPKPETTAIKLVRASAALVEHWQASVTRIVEAADEMAFVRKSFH